MHGQTGPDVTVVNEAGNGAINPGGTVGYGFNGSLADQNNPLPQVSCTAL